MAGEKDVKTKTGVSKAMVRAQQNGAFYGDTTQFDTQEFQELILLARQLNELEQQLLLSAQGILYRRRLTGFSLVKIQSLIPEVEDWLGAIDNRERKTGRSSTDAPPVAKPAVGSDSAANVGEFFAEPGSAAEPPPAAEAVRDSQPIYYYGEHRFDDDERVFLSFAEADQRLESLAGIHIVSSEDAEAIRKAGYIERSAYTYDHSPEVVARYRSALERERAELPAPQKATTLDDFADSPATGEVAGGGASPAKKEKPGRKLKGVPAASGVEVH